MHGRGLNLNARRVYRNLSSAIKVSMDVASVLRVMMLRVGAIAIIAVG
jgi:hypothetical protein